MSGPALALVDRGNGVFSLETILNARADVPDEIWSRVYQTPGARFLVTYCPPGTVLDSQVKGLVRVYSLFSTFPEVKLQQAGILVEEYQLWENRLQFAFQIEAIIELFHILGAERMPTRRELEDIYGQMVED